MWNKNLKIGKATQFEEGNLKKKHEFNWEIDPQTGWYTLLPTEEEPEKEKPKAEPKHYKRNGISVNGDILKVIYDFYGNDLTAKEGFYIGNIIKYLMRFQYKDDPISDLDKLIRYAEMLKDAVNRR